MFTSSYTITIIAYIWVGVVVTFLLLLLFTKPKSKSPHLDAEIQSKIIQLEHLENQIRDRTIDRNVSLTNIEIRCLDIYDKSGIRIPIDIIEDLSHLNLNNEKDIFAYIENQRYFWKLENTKKPFKETKI